MSSDLLREICDEKRRGVTRRKEELSFNALESAIAELPTCRGFRRALESKVAQQEIGLIAEIKKASPSGGLIRENFIPEDIASAYAKGGASCLSVLTDMPYFQGKPKYIEEVKTAVELPVLRKDFIVDPWQVYETRAIGADCLLLIVAALEIEHMKEIEHTAHEHGLDVLIEVHTHEELETALNHLQSRLIGVNNRNLKTLKIDLSTTETLAPLIPKEYTIICESGVATHKDVARISQIGVKCFLVGEALMRQTNIEQATRTLLTGI
jgi:indole-3-glycerol phosphate synthase